MGDSVAPEQRSLNMSLIRSRNTRPEVSVRSILHRMGFRFRNNVKKLPGRPDIVLPKYRAVIFVNGCFWHQHAGCSRATVPKSHVDYWKKKLARNVERDCEHLESLTTDNWRVMTVWECEISSSVELGRRLAEFIVSRRSPASE
ncbi:MAG: DNA mismatch endonuclease Vsr [Acidobacteria bacterium]|nr:DNA mismatch endonuclease Vsr [Acidobacteriota bacterium]